MQLPEAFISSMQSILSTDSERFFQSLDEPSPVSIRLNHAKTEARLSLAVPFEPVPWSRVGYYLSSRPSFTFDPLFQAGTYYVQEASSMFLEQIFEQYISPDATVLDLCAAPGGKSVLMASLLSHQGVLVSNEVVPNRASVLVENIQRQGYPHVVVTSSYAKGFSACTNLFDAVLVDAPCSGEGMFRKEPQALSDWSVENVSMCAERQQEIILHAWEALKEGGVLIYSTCTYNLQENEKNVAWIQEHLGGELLPVKYADDCSQISPSALPDKVAYAYRFFPYKTTGEGLFMAVLRKGTKTKEEVSSVRTKRRDKMDFIRKGDLFRELSSLLEHGDTYLYQEIGGRCFGYLPRVSEVLMQLHKNIKVLNAGVLIGEKKGDTLVPSSALALSTVLCRDAFQWHEVEEITTTWRYFRRETVTLPQGVEKGFVLLSYKDIPIGFVKNLGNRCNNLFPMDWRIRSSYNPSDDMCVEVLTIKKDIV